MSDSNAELAVTEQPSAGQLVTAITDSPPDQIDADMKHVLDGLGEMGARPLEFLSPATARRQPRATETISAILGRQGRLRPEDGVEAEDIEIPSGEDTLAVRLYRPMGLLSRLNPAVLYFHGGGFVTGDLDSHDASARAIARRTGAIVASVAYRLAPEHKFPAAHEDAWTAWRWLCENTHQLAGDPRRLAVAGEDAGANLAANVALRARDSHGVQPVHQLLVHPIAGKDFTTASYGDTARSQPIGLSAMRWRFRHLLEDDAAMADPRIDLVSRSDWAGVAPATITLAGIDPLRSEGEALAEAMENGGVRVNCWTYEGVTQGFLGLGLVVTKALFAQSDAADALGKAFAPHRRS